MARSSSTGNLFLKWPQKGCSLPERLSWTICQLLSPRTAREGPTDRPIESPPAAGAWISCAGGIWSPHACSPCRHGSSPGLGLATALPQACSSLLCGCLAQTSRHRRAPCTLGQELCSCSSGLGQGAGGEGWEHSHLHPSLSLAMSPGDREPVLSLAGGWYAVDTLG